jgi:hypothetical protein
MNAVIVSARPDFWHSLIPVISQRGFAVSLLSSLAEACAAMRKRPASLLILDLPYNFESLRSAVNAVLAADRLVKIAIVHNLPGKDFKELVSDKGAFPASLPGHPGAEDLTVLLNAFFA